MRASQGFAYYPVITEKLSHESFVWLLHFSIANGAFLSQHPVLQ